VKIDYRWTGNFLLTMSRMPQFGRIEKNAYYMQGYSGHGVTCSHLAGKLISEMIRGDAERFDAFASLPHANARRAHLSAPLTAMGAAYYSLRDRFGFKFYLAGGHPKGVAGFLIPVGALRSLLSRWANSANIDVV
jgi:gamma-glutamylputrescine oxidase